MGKRDGLKKTLVRVSQNLGKLARQVELAGKRRRTRAGHINLAARSNVIIAHASGRPETLRQAAARQVTTIRQGRGAASAPSDPPASPAKGKGGEL